MLDVLFFIGGFAFVLFLGAAWLFVVKANIEDAQTLKVFNDRDKLIVPNRKNNV